MDSDVFEPIDSCLFCQKKIIARNDGVIIKEKGLKTIIQCSIRREDGISTAIENLHQLYVHVRCRKQYTNEGVINALIKKRQLGAKTGQNTTCFKYTHFCIFCEEDASSDFVRNENKKTADQRSLVRTIQMGSTRTTITELAKERGTWGNKVLQRVQDVDLVSVGARYHRTCYDLFRKAEMSSEQRKRGRPETTSISIAMDEIFAFLESHREECQFSMNELKNVVSDPVECPDDRTIKRRLKEKYGDDLIITPGDGKQTVICFRATGHKILHDSWYTTKMENEEDERLRIVKTAASIILEDIRSKAYETSVFPSSENFLQNINQDIPFTLKTFLSNVILKNKKDTDSASKKCTAIAHSIITAVRPRSFISPLLLSVAILINQKFASKSLVDLLNSLGFSSSYYEATQFQISAIAHGSSTEETNFCQYVFDNADYNVKTIDGHNTFHAMGGIKCVTPAKKGNEEKILRLKKIPPKFIIGNFGHVSLELHEKCTHAKGLKKIIMRNFGRDTDIKHILPSWNDFLWIYGKKQEFQDVPGWNGFMEKITTKNTYETSEIVPLPFVNAPPTQYDTIYTSLLMAVENTKSTGMKTTIVTFDQPLYLKAMDIVTSSNDPRLSSVVVRLGGFHLLMSFMGAIGFIMNGSGLKELWSTVYASLSVDKMLSGHAYSRAVRGHTLTHLVLGKKLLDKTKLDDEDILVIEDIMLNDVANDESRTDTERETAILEKFNSTLEEISENGPTAKLWILYFKLVTLMKQFIESERSGNWYLHLEVIKKMLPFFNSSGHFSYAKCATLYLQDMYNLEKRLLPNEFKNFVQCGYFTIRRSDKYWSGIWSDMTIEQTLMRAMKSSGGLTRGRGLTDSVLAKWILAMPTLYKVSSSLEDFTGTSSYTTEQHIDTRVSRIIRDSQDAEKFEIWFETHDPFPTLDKIMSLSTGITGDDNINCYDAQSIGLKLMVKTEGNNFQDITYSRKDIVSPIASINSSIKVDDTRICIEPEMIFRRISFAKKTEEELKQYLHYELAPYPLSLFDEAGMKKGKKSALYELFTPMDNEPVLQSPMYVVDGGFLLHKVIWRKGITYSGVCDQYVNYLKKHFPPHVTVVFDGYPDNPEQNSTKTAERLRRKKGQIYAETIFTENMTITISQEKFLSNEKNKKKLIELLIKKFENHGIHARQSTEDADTLIIFTALDMTESFDTVVVVGEDVDLLVILTGIPDIRKSKVHFLKPGRGKIEKKMYSSSSFTEQSLSRHVLFLHAFSGCDTTSAIFRQGKKKLVDLLKKSKDLQETVLIFNDPNADREMIGEVGEKIFTYLYSTKPETKNINDIRFDCFARSITKSKFNLACLPPTSGAARQHSFRTYYQVQCWLDKSKEAVEWGWSQSNLGLVPILTLDDPAPQEILHIISCKCKNTCKNNCTCKKAGLNCSSICNNCSGKLCTGSIILDEPAEEDEGGIDIEKLLTECTENGHPCDGDVENFEPDIPDDDVQSNDKFKENQPEPAHSSKKAKFHG